MYIEKAVNISVVNGREPGHYNVLFTIPPGHGFTSNVTAFFAEKNDNSLTLRRPLPEVPYTPTEHFREFLTLGLCLQALGVKLAEGVDIRRIDGVVEYQEGEQQSALRSLLEAGEHRLSHLSQVGPGDGRVVFTFQATIESAEGIYQAATGASYQVGTEITVSAGDSSELAVGTAARTMGVFFSGFNL